MTKLTGTIVWIPSEIKDLGVWIPNSKKDGIIVTTKIENAIVDEQMIKFSTTPYEYESAIYSYNVNLNAGLIGLEFVGEYSDVTESEYKGNVSCYVFENKNQILLKGKWVEDRDYTWFAILDKKYSG